jgi:UPF0716 protein FxsA
VLPTIGLLLLDSILGAALLRHQGRAAWRRFRQALEEDRVPAKEVFDGAMVILGGAFLLTPGFITDVIGAILLIPPTRAAVRGIATRTAKSRFSFGSGAVMWGAGQANDRYERRRQRRHAPHPDDIEGTAHEVGDDPTSPGDVPPTLPR